MVVFFRVRGLLGEKVKSFPSCNLSTEAVESDVTYDLKYLCFFAIRKSVFIVPDSWLITSRCGFLFHDRRHHMSGGNR